MEPATFDELQWKLLINSIRDERCILFIGPMLASIRQVYQEDKERYITKVDAPLEDRDWSPINVQLALHLATNLLQYRVNYDLDYQTDLEYIAQRFLEIDRMAEADLKDIADEFIREHAQEIPPVYHLIKSLPTQFSLIVNTSPDTFLHQILDRRKHQFKWYNYEDNEVPELEDISKNYPLIYNLVGCIGQFNSLVLTEAQQLTFVRNIIQNAPKIPEKIINKLTPVKKSGDKTTYLFVGFNFERWQFRMLLDRLNISDRSKTIAPRHPVLQLQRRTAEFYISRFNFLFVEDQEEQFLEKLRQKLGLRASLQNMTARNVGPDNITQIFISYHDDDWAICNKVIQILKRLEKVRPINLWHRGMAKPGNLIDQINEQLRQSSYLIPLLSLSYISAEDDILLTESRFTLTQTQDNQQVIPILARPCPIDDAEFANMTVLPRNRKPLDDTAHWGSDQGYLAVYEELKELLQLSSNQRNP